MWVSTKAVTGRLVHADHIDRRATDAPSKEESTMAATSTITSRGASGNIGDEALARLRAALVADRAPQAALVRANDATAQALTGQRDVDSILEREIAEASAARARDALEDIDVALAKMAGGTYGACESCRAPIPIERLEAIPHSRRCVTCST
jgi:DnaK suppressor protein